VGARWVFPETVRTDVNKLILPTLIQRASNCSCDWWCRWRSARRVGGSQQHETQARA
jgi:hypothetical protein